jgi:hypothetical protein
MPLSMGLSTSAGEVPITTMELLWTNRLLHDLQSKNLRIELGEDMGTFRYDHIACMHEAELDFRVGASEVPFISSSQFEFSILKRLKPDNTDFGFSFCGIYDGLGSSSSGFTAGSIVSDDSTFHILWLSETEFVSAFRFSDCEEEYHDRHVDLMFTMSVQLRETSVVIKAYQFLPPDKRNAAKSKPPSGLALHFLAHLLSPIPDLVKEIEVEFQDACPPASSLSLVPTTVQNVPTPITITFVNSSEDFLRALAFHPVHPNVLLSFRQLSYCGISYAEINGLLHLFRKPVNVRVPDKLLHFEEEKLFTANPAITSLTVTANWETKVSSNLLDSTTENKSIMKLTVDCPDWAHRNPALCPDWINQLLCRAVLDPSSSIRSLTFVSRYDFVSGNQSMQKQQLVFHGLTQCLYPSFKGIHCLSKFHFAFPNSRYKPTINSNEKWDARFSPALILNCLQQQGGIPTTSISGIAIKRINQGILYSMSTNLFPVDLSASSASAIFAVLRCNMTHQASVLEGKPAQQLKSQSHWERSPQGTMGQEADTALADIRKWIDVVGSNTAAASLRVVVTSSSH